jgi:hypothetical protein
MYLPAGVELKEISKMKSDALQSCYAHWYTRQENGERAFLFTSVDPAHKRIAGQKRKEKVDDSGNSDAEEDASDPQISHKSK